jgi:Ni,Fe-hydrogenase III small subunit/Pyruvate/2-oxoacid:ferredoxin oxidoreductase delta subunit
MPPQSQSPPIKLFRINAGSCNGCDVELAATAAVSHLDVSQLGCGYCESPAEADIVLVTGPLTVRVRERVLALYAAVPEPKVTVAIGVCPVSCGVFRDSYAVAGPVDRYLQVEVNVPGCPPRPQAILHGLAKAVRLWRRKNGEDPAPVELAAEEPAPALLRGRPEFNPAACVGCGMCAHVCAAGAIRIAQAKEGSRFLLWENSCVFCGLCSHYCPSGALTMGGDWQLSHLREQQFRRVAAGEIPAQSCDGCGDDFVSASPELMRRAYRGGSAELERLRRLCPDCRRSFTAGTILRGGKP